MDLAKIIGELRVELQCLDTAIASMEELARVQNVSDLEGRTTISSAPDPEPATPAEQPLQGKRRRGRPRKDASAARLEPPAPTAPEDSEPEDGDTSPEA